MSEQNQDTLDSKKKSIIRNLVDIGSDLTYIFKLILSGIRKVIGAFGTALNEIDEEDKNKTKDDSKKVQQK